MFHTWGMLAPFKPGESLAAYDDNAWLAGAVDKIAQELARTPVFLKKANAKGEITIIPKHDALDTLRRPSGSTTNRRPCRESRVSGLAVPRGTSMGVQGLAPRSRPTARSRNDKTPRLCGVLTLIVVPSP